jgi:hypothetical protein
MFENKTVMKTLIKKIGLNVFVGGTGCTYSKVYIWQAKLAKKDSSLSILL